MALFNKILEKIRGEKIQAERIKDGSPTEDKYLLTLRRRNREIAEKYEKERLKTRIEHEEKKMLHENMYGTKETSITSAKNVFASQKEKRDVHHLLNQNKDARVVKETKGKIPQGKYQPKEYYGNRPEQPSNILNAPRLSFSGGMIGQPQQQGSILQAGNTLVKRIGKLKYKKGN